MKSPKSKSMNVDLTAQSHELPKKKRKCGLFFWRDTEYRCLPYNLLGMAEIYGFSKKAF